MPDHRDHEADHGQRDERAGARLELEVLAEEVVGEHDREGEQGGGSILQPVTEPIQSVEDMTAGLASAGYLAGESAALVFAGILFAPLALYLSGRG